MVDVTDFTNKKAISIAKKTPFQYREWIQHAKAVDSDLLAGYKEIRR